MTEHKCNKCKKNINLKEKNIFKVSKGYFRNSIIEGESDWVFNEEEILLYYHKECKEK